MANAHVIAGYALEALGQQHEAGEQWALYLKEDPTGPNAKRAQEAVGRLTKSPLSSVGVNHNTDSALSYGPVRFHRADAPLIACEESQIIRVSRPRGSH